MNNLIIKEGATAPTVGEVFRYTFAHPIEMLVWRWNWKASLLAGILRSSIYLATHIQFGWEAALGAMSVEFIFRIIITGACGSLLQAFHRATPMWLGTLCILVMLPGITHLLEFGIHSLNGDQGKGTAIIISIIFSMISAFFNLFAMRRGLLLVKDANQQSFWKDLKQFPLITLEFIFYPLVWWWRKTKKNAEAMSLSNKPEIIEES